MINFNIASLFTLLYLINKKNQLENKHIRRGNKRLQHPPIKPGREHKQPESPNRGKHKNDLQTKRNARKIQKHKRNFIRKNRQTRKSNSKDPKRTS